MGRPDTLLTRREFLRRVAVAGAGLAAGGGLVGLGSDAAPVEGGVAAGGAEPVAPGAAAAGPRAFTTGRYIEFSEDAGEVERLAARFGRGEWRVHIGGLLEREHDLTLAELLQQMPLESRPYDASRAGRVSESLWTGFPLAALVHWARPREQARYLRVDAFVRPDVAPNQQRAGYLPWPYREGLTLADATDPRAFVATGMDGRDLPPHRGAPLRLVLPWKRGSKGVKAVTRFEFTERQPRTFWGDATPRDYDFTA